MIFGTTRSLKLAAEEEAASGPSRSGTWHPCPAAAVARPPKPRGARMKLAEPKFEPALHPMVAQDVEVLALQEAQLPHTPGSSDQEPARPGHKVAARGGRFFFRMAGFRHSNLLKVLAPQLEPLTEEQQVAVGWLRQAVDALSQGMDAAVKHEEAGATEHA